uniref:Uncharacterized protein n=1 Tax=Arundo donax TaxID=35708 RepID=A0A0A9G069_ARUDO
MKNSESDIRIFFPGSRSTISCLDQEPVNISTMLV